jgi:CheY-like chemotaxis protein
MRPITSVLIVDDEPGVRDLMSRWVSALGLDVRTAGNADQALERLNERQSDLAVIDIMMPGKTGLWLAGELQREHPHTAVVLATGHRQLLDGSREAPVADLLIKPFNGNASSSRWTADADGASRRSPSSPGTDGSRRSSRIGSSRCDRHSPKLERAGWTTSSL